MNPMSILSTVITVLFLGFLYWRMVKREIPEPVGRLQALLPIALGLLSHPLTVPFSSAYLKALAANPNTLLLTELNFFQSFWRALIVAGGLEEISKLIMILLALFIFRKKVKNVYEYVLIGACVGMGFSLIEEFTYGGTETANIITTMGRMIGVPAHMTFNMVMAEFLGSAKFNKLNGKGTVVLNYVLALLVPIVFHTLFDTCTVFNSSMMRGELSGIIRALIGYVALLIYELIVLVRFKKKTATLCGMSTLVEEAA